MPSTLQEFFAEVTPKAAADLEAALKRLPEDKRNWKAGEKARSAADMVAECAILNGTTAEMIVWRTFPAFDSEAYDRQRAELIADEAALLALLHENTAKVVETLRAVPDADLNAPFVMPWETSSLAEVISYPNWNMKYHEGQINFIASLLGVLD